MQAQRQGLEPGEQELLWRQTVVSSQGAVVPLRLPCCALASAAAAAAAGGVEAVVVEEVVVVVVEAPHADHPAEMAGEASAQKLPVAAAAAAVQTAGRHALCPGLCLCLCPDPDLVLLLLTAVGRRWLLQEDLQQGAEHQSGRVWWPVDRPAGRAP